MKNKEVMDEIVRIDQQLRKVDNEHVPTEEEIVEIFVDEIYQQVISEGHNVTKDQVREVMLSDDEGATI